MEVYVIRDVKGEISRNKYYNFLTTIHHEKKS